MACDSLRAQVVALVNQLTAAAAKAAAAAAQADAAGRDRVAAAQKQLSRIGCFAGAANGQMNDATQSAITRYLTQKGRTTAQTDVTDDLVTELSKQSSRVCPLECPEGQTASGSICVATAAPAAPATAKSDDGGAAPPQKNQRDNTASKPAPKPQARQQAEAARPRVGGTSIGVGF